MDLRQTAVLVLTLWSILVSGQSPLDCNPWFGSLCQYKCRCSDNNCTKDGVCVNDVPCQKGWFGPACQYADLAYNRSSAREATDGDDNTCLTTPTDLTVTLDNRYHVTWLRVRLSKPADPLIPLADFPYNITVHFREKAGLSCTNNRTAHFDNTTLDIHCDLNETVKHVKLAGPGVQHLCSVYISGGRNVALRQHSSQSSTYSENSKDTGYINISYTSDKAVDGDTDPMFYRGNTCTHTHAAVSNSNLNITFFILQRVTRYILYNRIGRNSLRLQGFELRSFGPSMTSVFNYTDRISSPLQVYTVIPNQVTSSIHLVNIAVYKNECILTLCELEFYGDSACQPGQYGRECEHSCNCAGGQSCFVSTGGCPSGCAAGYLGPDCQTACDPGSYGPRCESPCSQFCVRDNDTGSHYCNIIDGTCVNGCQSGYQGSTCNTRCDVGSHGPQCNFSCSQFCARDKDQSQHFCDNINGTCLHGCQSGYQGSICAESCDVGSYGPQCNVSCSQFCAKDNNRGQHLCDNINGTCLKGCQSGYQGPGCAERCDVGSYGPQCNVSCSQFCARDNDRGQHLCDNINGTCLGGCQSGYQGSTCAERCDVGRHGSQCQSSCSQFCSRDKDQSQHFCDNINGTCLHGCQSGYQGPTCAERCDVGSYGPQCNSSCSQFCATDNNRGQHFCDNINGTCLHGCQSGYQGSTCAERLPSNVVVVVVAVLGGVGVLVLVMVAVCFYRRRTVPKHGPSLDLNDNDDDDYDESNDVILSTSKAAVSFRHHHVKHAGEIQEANGRQKGPDDDSTEMYQNVNYGNSSSVVPLDGLADFMKFTNREFFVNQFCVIPSNQAATMNVGQSPDNKDKNRYKNICPYDHSRVHLLPNKDKNQGDYINASFVQGYRHDERFIASQGPTKTILEDFLRMLWEQEVDKVVMLTNLVEDGKQKCERYWPEEDHLKVGEMTVRLAATRVFADCTIRRLQLRKDGEPWRNVIQFHFTAWPDNDTPTAPWGLVDFEQRVASYPTNKPVVVHCSAGVGRTGTFIALRNVMREAEETGHMDFFTTVRKLRQDRINMVQTVDQYIFLHRAALAAILCTGSSLPLADVDQRMLAIASKSKSGVTELEREFQTLCSVSGEQMEEKTTEDSPFPGFENNQNVVNSQKNRVPSVLAQEMYRAVLSGDNSDTSDYINAVLVPSFLRQNQEILTQLPLPATILDLWRLVTQYKVSLMVAFETDKKATDQTVGDYLPASEGGATSVGKFTLRTEAGTSTTLWKQEKVVISQDADINSTADKPWRVTHVTCTTNLDPASLLAVTQHVRSLKPAADERTLYMCRNGAEYSGLVYVLSLLLDRLDNDHHLTVPLVVGAIKAMRPQVIPTLDQYGRLYQVLQLYSHSMNEYSNFAH